MKKAYSDDDIKNILTVSIQNEVVDARIAETLKHIRQGAHKTNSKPKMRRWKKAVYGTGTVAAAMFAAICICAANPSLAANIPILGDIFAKVQDVFLFGKLPEEETRKLYEDRTGEEERTNAGKDSETEAESASEPAKEAQDYLYRSKSSGITITFTEYYASNQAIFFGVCVENDEKFPEFATMGDYDYQLVQVNTQEQYSFRDTQMSGFRAIEGRLVDPYTFVGVMRVDYDTINVDSSKYDAACEEAEAKGEELPTINDETRDYYLGRYEVPETFEMQMEIVRLRGYCPEVLEIEEESKYTVVGGTSFQVRGDWRYPSVTIQQSSKDVRTIRVDAVNEQGIGVEKIEISPVELTLSIVEPVNSLLYGVVLDKEGKMLVNGSSNPYELTIAGRDISTVSIYICDYEEYMDEIKALDLESSEKLQNALEEKALFKIEVDTTK